MALKKIIDGKWVTLAGDSVVSHEQLLGREAYGAHPISAIRKLPEKLHNLKLADEQLAETIDTKIAVAEKLINNVLKNTEHLDGVLDATVENMNILSNSLNKVTLRVEGPNVIFTDANGQVSRFKVGDDVDNNSIRVNDEDKLEIKKVYLNEADLLGDGTKESPLYLKVKPDDYTLNIEEDKYIVKGIQGSSTEQFIDYNFIINRNNQVDNLISDVNTSIANFRSDFDSNNLTIQNKFNNLDTIDSEHNHKIADLYTRTQGLGGFLNAYNFGKNPTNDQLTQYALQDTGAANQTDIFNGTKVKNLYDNHIWVLTNTPDSEPAIFSWQDIGEDAVISDANNDGVHGLVTGSYEHLEGWVDVLGHITINGLSDELNSRVDKSTDQSIAGTKTFTGSVIVPDVTIS